jgi:WD40 repeat protein
MNNTMISVEENSFAVLRGHKNPVWKALFSPDGTFLVSSDETQLCIWEWYKKKKIVLRDQIHANTSEMTISPDGNYLVFLENVYVFENKVHVSLSDGTRIMSWSPCPNARKIAFRPGDIHLLVVDIYGCVQLWDMVGPEPSLLYEIKAPFESIQTFENSTVRHIAFAPDGKRFAMTWGTKQGRVHVYDIEAPTGKHSMWNIIQSGSLISSMCGISDLLFSPDGRYLAVTSHSEFHVVLFDAFTLNVVGSMEFSESTTGIAAMAFSPNGQYLAIGGCDGTVWIGHVSSQKVITMFHAHTSTTNVFSSVLSSMSWSPDGKLIVTTGIGEEEKIGDQEEGKCSLIDDYTVKLWKVL